MKLTDNKSANFIEDGTIYIHDDFDESISRYVIPGFNKMFHEKKNIRSSTITIDINSQGGHTPILYSMLELVERCKRNGITIDTRVAGYALSCGSLLAASGSLGHRYAFEYSTHLCHLGFVQCGWSKNDTEAERGLAFQLRHFNEIRRLYKKYATIPDLDDVIKNDNLFIFGKKIVKWGLADKIV